MTMSTAHSDEKLSSEHGPMPLPLPTSNSNSNTFITTELTTIHHIFIRALNGVYLQASDISLSEYSKFTYYSLTIYRCLVAHDPPTHSTFFTELAWQTGEKRFMSGHEEFYEALRGWGIWLESCDKGRNNLSPSVGGDFMNEISHALQTHLGNVPELLVRVPNPNPISATDVSKTMRERRKMVFGGTSKTNKLPALVLNHDDAMGELPRGMNALGR
jgi:hypothetical protein